MISKEEQIKKKIKKFEEEISFVFIAAFSMISKFNVQDGNLEALIYDPKMRKDKVFHEIFNLKK